MKILCHIGPWCEEYFKFVSKGFESTAHVVFCSGFRRLDQTVFTETYRSRYKEIKTVDEADISAADQNVITRCRLLRTLSPGEAARHVQAVRFAVRKMLSQVKPDVFLCETADQYFHHILFEECAAKSIPAFGIVQTFVNGYFRVSKMGERCSIRTVSQDECVSVLRQLEDKNYIPEFITKQKKNLYKSYRKAWLSNLARVLYFGVYRLIAYDLFNYHYWASSRSIWFNHVHFLPISKLGNQNWEAEVQKENRPSIFIPLQFFPEATIDYWVEEQEFVDYERSLIDLLTRLSGDFKFIVKEHPGVWGHRHPSFYKKLSKVPGLVFCPTSEMAQRCIEVCDATLVWTGSVGFETAMRGKATLSVTKPYYQSGRFFKKIGFNSTAAEINEYLSTLKANPISEMEKTELVRFLLEGIDHGKIQVDGSFDASNQSDVSSAIAIGAILRQHFDAHIAA